MNRDTLEENLSGQETEPGEMLKHKNDPKHNKWTAF